MGVIEKLQRVREIAERRRDQFEQRFGVIGGDVRMRQCRTQAGRVRSLRNAAVGSDAQAFFFQADLAATQYFANIVTEKVSDAIFDVRAQWGFQTYNSGDKCA